METKLPITGVVETRMGQLSFEGGYPSHDTVDKLYEEMDLQRARRPTSGPSRWSASLSGRNSTSRSSTPWTATWSST